MNTETEDRGEEEVGGGELGGEEKGEVKTKLEVTQEEIFAGDEEDAQKREEEKGVILLALPPLTPEVLNIDDGSTMDCNRKMDGSSDWSGRGRARWRHDIHSATNLFETQLTLSHACARCLCGTQRKCACDSRMCVHPPSHTR